MISRLSSGWHWATPSGRRVAFGMSRGLAKDSRTAIPTDHKAEEDKLEVCDASAGKELSHRKIRKSLPAAGNKRLRGCRKDTR